MSNPDPYVTEHGSLTLHCLTAKMRENTVGYWYTVTSGATPLTAFRTRDELLEWADTRGLDIAEPVPEPDPTKGASMQISGLYRRALHRDVSVFNTLCDVVHLTPILDNGGYTLGKITADEDGNRTEHVLNINYRDGIFPFDRCADYDTVQAFIDAQ